MRITKQTRVAVDVHECTTERKQFVRDWLKPGNGSDVLTKELLLISDHGSISINYKRGLAFYEEEKCPVVSYQEFLEGINPYAGKTVQVHCDNEAQYEYAQGYAFNLGYRWGVYGTTIQKGYEEPVLGLSFNEDGNITHSDRKYAHKYDLVISFDEFMRSEVPEDRVKEKPVQPPKPHRPWVASVVKRDGWYEDGYICHIHNGKELKVSMKEVCQYNFLTKEDYLAKYPQVLKLREWEITQPDASHIKVGCCTIQKKYVKGFYQVMSILKHHHERGEDVPTSREAYDFINEHKKELGI